MTIGWRIAATMLSLLNVYIWARVVLLLMRVLGLG
jgi:hypothetical protein